MTFLVFLGWRWHHQMGVGCCLCRSPKGDRLAISRWRGFYTLCHVTLRRLGEAHVVVWSTLRTIKGRDKRSGCRLGLLFEVERVLRRGECGPGGLGRPLLWWRGGHRDWRCDWLG